MSSNHVAQSETNLVTPSYESSNGPAKETTLPDLVTEVNKQTPAMDLMTPTPINNTDVMPNNKTIKMSLTFHCSPQMRKT